MAQEPQVKPKSNDFLTYLRERNPFMRSVGDSELTAYIKDRRPDLAQYLQDEPVQPQVQERSLGGALLEGASNIPSSAGKFVSDIWGAVSQPKETLTGLGRTALGVGKIAANPMAQLDPNDQSVQAGKAFVEGLVNRYGGWDNIKNTLATDPVGFLADASTFFTGAGGATRATSKTAVGAKVSGALGKAAAITDPLTPVRPSIIAKATPKSIPRRLYESGAKFSTSIPAEKRMAMVETAMREEILPNRAGLDKARGIITQLQKEVGAIVDDAAQRGVAVDANLVVQKVDDAKPFWGEVVGSEDIVSKMDELKQEFIQRHGQSIPVDVAQRIKQKTNAVLRDSYGELKGWEKEYRKSVVRGLKDEIAKIHPDLNKLNAREGALIELEKALEQSVNRIENKDLLGLGSGVAGGVGYAAGGPTGFLSGLAAKWVIEKPTIKARLAIALDKAKRKPATGSVVTPVSVAGRATPQGQGEDQTMQMLRALFQSSGGKGVSIGTGQLPF